MSLKNIGRICAPWRIACSPREADAVRKPDSVGLMMRDVANLRGWLTTVVSRVCLDMLRARTSRREDPLDACDPIITAVRGPSPAMRADSVTLRLIVLTRSARRTARLRASRRLRHDVRRDRRSSTSPLRRAAASRARRRVQGNAPSSDRDLRQQRRLVDAFLAASREGNFEHLVALLDPDIVLRADGGALAGASRVVRGAKAVAGQAAAFSKLGLSDQIVLVNGNVGLLERRPDGRLFAVIGFTIADGRIAEMNILADPDRLSRLDLSAIER